MVAELTPRRGHWHRPRIIAALAAASLWVGTVQAHEFWLLPDRFTPPPGARVQLSLSVGEQFVGDPVAFGKPVVSSLRLVNAAGEQDLTQAVPDTANQRSIPVAFAQAGGKLVVVDTHPFSVDLPGEKFNAYLREEGLEGVLAQREAASQSDRPGRERYRRHVKSLLQVGGHTDATWRTRTGQTLELRPLADPATTRAGDRLGMQVDYLGAPLAQALVKAWHLRDGQLTVARGRTDAQGQIQLRLPWAGVWMVSVVHMVPTSDTPGIDWDSHWGNLTFELMAAGTQTPMQRKASPVQPHR